MAAPDQPPSLPDGNPAPPESGAGGRVGHRTFRPPLLLRLLLAGIGGFCGVCAVGLVLSSIQLHESRWLIFLPLFCLPGVLTVIVARRSVQVTEAGLVSTSLLRKQEIPWSAVRRLDRRRRSFVVETAQGPVSAGWLAPGEREILLRLIVQGARLSLSADEPPWGVQARYLPRVAPITFVPHHARKKHDRDH